MNTVFGILLGLLIVAAIAGVAWLYFYIRKLKRQKLAAIAQELSLAYYPGRNDNLHETYSFFELFQRGRNRRSYDLISGSRDGIKVMLFDFYYEDYSDNDNAIRWRTSCILELPPGRQLPYVIIRPEGAIDRIASAIGFNDIDFESVEFSRKFFVKSQDRRFAYDLIHPKMMEYLLTTGSIWIEVAKSALLVHQDCRLYPRQWTGLYQKAVGFYTQIPDRLLSTS